MVFCCVCLFLVFGCLLPWTVGFIISVFVKVVIVLGFENCGFCFGLVILLVCGCCLFETANFGVGIRRVFGFCALFGFVTYE